MARSPAPRVLWLALAGDTAGAAALAAALNRALGLEGRGGLHLTVARAGRDPRALGHALRALAGARSAPFEVRAVTLYQSRDGAYRPLHRAPLVG